MLTAKMKRWFLLSRSAETNGNVEANVRLNGKRKTEDYADFLTKRQKLLNDYR